MTDKIEIKSKLLELIERDFAVKKETISEETKIDDIGIDRYSTDFVDLLIAIEDKFEINIDNDEFLKINNISEIIDLVSECLDSKENQKMDNDNII